MRDRTKLIILAVAVIAVTAGYIFINMGPNFDYVFQRRGQKVLAMLFTGTAIAYSSVIFQTISYNRILTPSIMGFDSMYLFIQTLIVFFYGSKNFLIVDSKVNFVISAIFLMAFIGVLYKVVFKRDGNVFFFMLVGVVLGTLFRSLSTFMQMLIDPNEFAVVQDKMFASFNSVHVKLLSVSAVLIFLAVLLGIRLFKYLDVMLLGKEHSINLGINYNFMVKMVLLIVTVLVAVSTSLVGPIMFLGILVSNLAYELLKTYKHVYVILAASLISMLALVSGQLIIERIFNFSITISVIINFVGGIYFMYLLLKESKKC